MTFMLSSSRCLDEEFFSRDIDDIDIALWRVSLAWVAYTRSGRLHLVVVWNQPSICVCKT